MIELNVYEVGIDDLPVDGSEIVYFDSTTSYGMFEQYYSVEGPVEYFYGDFADSLEEALEKGYEITIDDDLYNEDGEPIKIDLRCKDRIISRNDKWMYVHEYYPKIGSITFPFQTQEYFEVAIKQGWIELKSREIPVIDYTKFENYDPIRHKSFEGIKFIYDEVEFNGKLFKVTWTTGRNDSEHNFHDYKEL